MKRITIRSTKTLLACAALAGILSDHHSRVPATSPPPKPDPNWPGPQDYVGTCKHCQTMFRGNKAQVQNRRCAIGPPPA